MNYSKEIGYKPLLLNAVETTNQFQVEQIIDLVKKNLGKLSNKKIGILGLSFKENTDDVRESVSIKLISLLLKQNVQILVQ